ncbi:MAG: hypothetical protein ACPF8V_05060 [Luteibaculum sp.]
MFAQRIITALILFALLALVSCSVFKGKGKSDKWDHYKEREIEFSSYQMNALREATTVFFIPSAQKELKGDYVRSFQEHWGLNPFIVDLYENREKYQRGNFAFLKISGKFGEEEIDLRSKKKASEEEGQQFIPEIFLSLYMPLELKDKRGRLVKTGIDFARQDLYLEPEAEMQALAQQSKEQTISMMYRDAEIHNLSPGLLALYLLEIQRNLDLSKRPYIKEKITREQELEKLGRNVLYLPKYALKKFDKYGGSQTDSLNIEEIKEVYPGKLEILSKEELSTLILNGIEVFVLDLCISGPHKWVNVYSSHSGKIFQRYASGEKDLDLDDFSPFSKYVEQENPE